MAITMTPQYNTILFTEIYDDVDEFKEDYTLCGIPETITDKSITTLFYLLYAKYGNNPIANMDINQFKYKLFSTIFQYGPNWEKKLDIQDKLRNLTEEELLLGGKNIYNHAYNPSSIPATGTLEELQYINDQNTSNRKRSKMEAYSLLIGLLDSDITEDFLRKFSILFKQFVSPEKPLLYITEDEDLEV